MKRSFKRCAAALLGAAVLAGLGLAGFLLYPRVPEVRLLGVSRRGATISVRSANYVDYTVRRVRAEYEALGATQATLQRDDFVIRRRSTTTLTIPVTGFSPSAAALQHCLLHDALPGSLRIALDLAVLRWTGKTIRTSRPQSLPCGELRAQHVPPAGTAALRRVQRAAQDLTPAQLEAYRNDPRAKELLKHML